MKARIYQSTAAIPGTPGARPSWDVSAEGFGGSQMGAAVGNLSKGLDRLAGAMSQIGNEEREQVLAAEIMRDTLQYKQDISQVSLALEEKYKGVDAPQAIAEMNAFTKKRQAEIMQKYGENEFAQRALMHKLTPISATGIEWSGSYARSQRQELVKSAAELANAELERAMPLLSPDQFEQALLRMNEEQKVGIFRGNPDAIKTYNKEAWAKYGNLKTQADPEYGARVFGGGWTEKYESGAAGIRAIGKDTNGGNSYGTYQMSSSQNTMGSFVKWLGVNGFSEAHKHFSTVKNWNSEEGKKAWNEALDKNLINNDMEKRFIEETHLTPVYASLPTPLQEKIQADPAYMEILKSTAVQHGPRAVEVLSRAYEQSGGEDLAFVSAVYEDRSKRFGSSTPQEREAVQRRLREEKDMALMYFNTPPSEREALRVGAVNTVEKRNKEVAAAQIDATVKNLFQRSKELGLSLEEGEAWSLAQVNSGGKHAEETAKGIKKRFEMEKEVTDSQDAVTGYGVIDSVEKGEMDYTAGLSAIEQSGMQRKNKDKFASLLSGGTKDDVLNRRKIGQMYKYIDDKKLPLDPEKAENFIRTWGMRNSIKPDDLNGIVKYHKGGGKEGQWTHTEIRNTLKEFGKDVDFGDSLIQQVYNLVESTPKDKDPNAARRAVAKAIMDIEIKDHGFLNRDVSTTYGEARFENIDGEYLAKPDEDDPDWKRAKETAAKEIEAIPLDRQTAILSRNRQLWGRAPLTAEHMGAGIDVEYTARRIFTEQKGVSNDKYLFGETAQEGDE